MSRNGKQGVSVPENRLASVHRRTVRRQRIRMIVTYIFAGCLGCGRAIFLLDGADFAQELQAPYSSESIPKFFTLHPSPGELSEAFTAVPLARYFLNTLIFTLATTALMLIVIVFSAFALRDWNSGGGTSCLRAFLSLMMIPSELVIITNFDGHGAGTAQHIPRTDPAVGHIHILHIPAQGELRAGAG